MKNVKDLGFVVLCERLEPCRTGATKIWALQAAEKLCSVKGTGFTGCGKTLFLKGTGFSPYVNVLE
jgi:hypothetical protein